MENKVFVVRDNSDGTVAGYKVFKDFDTAEKFAIQLNEEWKVVDYYVDEFEWVE